MELIKQLIKETKMNKKTLANELGANRVNVWRWENGKSVMNADSLVKLIQIAIKNGADPNQVINWVMNTKI